MHKKYKLYLFDLDGTTLDSDEMIRITMHEIYKAHKPSDFIVDDRKILNFSGPQISVSLKQEFPEKDIEFLLSEWKKYSEKNYDKYVKLYPGTLELFKTLKEKNILFGVVTNKMRYATDYSYNLLGLADLHIFSVCADEVKNIKPNPEGIFKAMKHFGITDKNDVIYIGDSKYDYLTAKNAGINFGYVSWSPRKLEDGAKIDLIIEDYATFAEDFYEKD